jgi:hypothetical protein
LLAVQYGYVPPGVFTNFSVKMDIFLNWII